MAEKKESAAEESTAETKEEQRKQRVRDALARFRPKRPRGQR